MGCLCSAAFIAGADQQLLPASFRAMEVDLGFHPYELSALSLCFGVSAALFGPVWAIFVDLGYSRNILLAVAAAAWGVCTICQGFVSSFWLFCMLRVLNGASVAMLVPIAQSFVADIASPEERGYIFGTLALSQDFGQLITALSVTPISNKTILGMAGWRLAFVCVGVVSWLFAVLLGTLLEKQAATCTIRDITLMGEAKKFISFFRIPTFTIFVLQGVFGTIPNAAMNYSTMYFQYIGLPDFSAALVSAMYITGTAFGNLFGGMLGDALSIWSPNHGRALTAQMSMLLGVIFATTVYYILPRRAELEMQYACILLCLGLTSAWVATGCIRPVMCEVIPRSRLATAYTWDSALVFLSGNLWGPTLVSHLSHEHFGYESSPLQVADMPRDLRATNASALGKALALATAVPWILSILAFSMVHITYKDDARTARREALAAAPDEATALQTS